METTKYTISLDDNLNETKVPISGSNSKNSNGQLNDNKTYDTLETKATAVYQVYKKRFIILLLFSLFSLSNSFQWIEYSIVATIIAPYYNVSNKYINYTSLIYMILYIPGILPATWVLSKKGLRFCVCLAALGNCLGAFIKCFSTNPDHFWLLMIGQSIVAVSQLFILNIPPNLSAVWFPQSEVSSATAFGVFGNQIGIAIGFVLPPYMISAADPGAGLSRLSWIVFGVTFTIFIAILLIFDEKPNNPPSAAQFESAEYNSKTNYLDVLKIFFFDIDFVFLFISYGINVGVFYAVSTLLEQIVNLHFVNSSKEAGSMGLLLTLAGTVGSVISGIILDKTHLFKLTTLVLYLISLIGLVLFTLCLFLPTIWPLYFISAFLGFFMTGYLPIGFEFAAELTYPQHEGTTAGLLNMSCQIFGISFTLISSELISKYGDLYSNLLLCICLAIGLLMTARISNQLKRQNAFAAVSTGESNT